MQINDIDPTTIFTVLGASLGAGKAFFKVRDGGGPAERIVNYLLSFVVAIALTNITIDGHQLAWGAYLGVGAFFGLVAMDLINCVQALAPSITTRFIKAKAKQLLGVDLDEADRKELDNQKKGE